MNHRFRAFRHRDFRLFFSVQLVSLVGSWMQNLAQGWLLWRLTGSSWFLGLLGFFQMGPVLLFGLPSGIVADRFDRYRLVLLTQSLACIQAAALALLTLGGVIRVWHLLALAAFLGLVNTFDMTARQAFLVRMVGPVDLPNAIALNSVLFNGARIVGPAIAGWVVERYGESACFAANAVSFLVVLGGLLLMRVERDAPDKATTGAWSQLREGLVFAYRHPEIRGILTILAGAACFGMAYLFFLPAVAGEVLGLGARGMGMLLTLAGIGAIGGALFMAGYRHPDRLLRLARASAFAFGLGLAAFGLSRSPGLSCLLLVPVGFGMMTSMSCANMLIQNQAPEALRGRLVSLYIFAFGGLSPVGSLLLGALSRWIGVQAALTVGGLVTAAVAISVRVGRNAAPGPEAGSRSA
ncbi:MAG: MFS transporter [Acidobacteria bacterium]|nr:MFS transporter [Acidobacteriota bacterium]